MTNKDERVTADYLRKAAEMTRRIKERSYELMRIAPGSSVLDIGCGPAIDTIPLALLVGDSGRVIGIDNDRDMLAKADAAAAEQSLSRIIRHEYADAVQMPFDEGIFDAARAERLLQVLPKTCDPAAVLADMVRVTRKQGWVVMADTDWATASVDFSDPKLERKLITFFGASVRPNGYAGRRLAVLFKQSGLANITIEAFPLVQTKLTDTPFGNWLQEEALKAGVATKEEVRAWRDELEAREEKGEFFSIVTMLVAAGQKG